MTLRSMNEQLLILEEPRSVYRTMVFILIMLGIIGTMAIFLSSEHSRQGMIYYFFLAAGLLGYGLGGKPDRAEFNKTTNQLRLLRYPHTFGPGKEIMVALTQISAVGMAEMTTGKGHQGRGSKKNYNLYLVINHQEKIELCGYSPIKLFRLRALRQLKKFLVL